MIKQKYIILDRDGVINQDSPNYIKTPNEFIPLPRSLSAIKLLTDNDFSIIIISNLQYFIRLHSNFDYQNSFSKES